MVKITRVPLRNNYRPNRANDRGLTYFPVSAVMYSSQEIVFGDGAVSDWRLTGCESTEKQRLKYWKLINEQHLLFSGLHHHQQRAPHNQPQLSIKLNTIIIWELIGQAEVYCAFMLHHNNPHHSSLSGEDKSWNKSSIKTFLTQIP